MNAFEFHCPTKIICGKNALHKLPVKMADRNVTKPLVVTDENLVKLGIAEHVFAPLKEADIDYVVYDKVPPDSSPTETAAAAPLAVSMADPPPRAIHPSQPWVL